VVEDDPDAATVATGMLGHLGFGARVAPDGPAALQALADQRFDLVLLDLCLPGMDGVRFLEVANHSSALDGVPVLAATGVYKADSAVVKVVAQRGARRVLRKPFALPELRAAVQEVMPLPARLRPPGTGPSGAVTRPGKAVPTAPPARRAPTELPTESGEHSLRRLAALTESASHRKPVDPAESDPILAAAGFGRTTGSCRVDARLGDDLILLFDHSAPAVGDSVRLQIDTWGRFDHHTSQLKVKVLGRAEKVRRGDDGVTRVRMSVQAATPETAAEKLRRNLSSRKKR